MTALFRITPCVLALIVLALPLRAEEAPAFDAEMSHDEGFRASTRSDTEAHSLVGCWERDFQGTGIKQDNQHRQIPFSVMCLSRKLTFSGIFIGRNGYGHSSNSTWSPQPAAVVLDGEKCGYSLNQGGDSLVLLDCVYEGSWLRACSVLNETEDACASSLQK